MEELFIPSMFLKNKELNITECFVLALYRHYTLKTDQHCCTLSNKEVCASIGLTDVRNLRRMKRHLKELGYIKIDGMIVTYVSFDESDNGKNDRWVCEI